MAIFLTGSTGFLGRFLLRRLLEEGQDMVLLVRGQEMAELRKKVTRALGSDQDLTQLEASGRLGLCRGDLSQPGLGLDASARGQLLERCTSVLHCGANVRFDLSLEEARIHNVEGTRSVLELASEIQTRGRLERVDYVGTAYVAGRREGIVQEDELDAGQAHKNTYERSKFEAETLVRQFQKELPLAIHRPSIVTGESQGGRTSSFKMIYWPTRVYALGLWRICPGNPEAWIDLVPVDFVRDAILALRQTPESLGGCFHIASGPNGDVQLGQMARRVQEIFLVRKPVRFVQPGWWMRWVHPLLKLFALGRLRRVIRTGEHYVPYFSQNPRFDNARTLQLLKGRDLPVPRVQDYIETLFRYCIDTNWGQNPLPPAGAASSRELNSLNQAAQEQEASHVYENSHH